jgi:hypothetical protein
LKALFLDARRGTELGETVIRECDEVTARMLCTKASLASAEGLLAVVALAPGGHKRQELDHYVVGLLSADTWHGPDELPALAPGFGLSFGEPEHYNPIVPTRGFTPALPIHRVFPTGAEPWALPPRRVRVNYSPLPS